MPVAFASYAAVAIENARLYETAQEQAWISAVLLKVAEATQSLTTRDCRLPYLWPSPEPCCGRRL
jgi:GAF domain-containing protein